MPPGVGLPGPVLGGASFRRGDGFEIEEQRSEHVILPENQVAARAFSRRGILLIACRRSAAKSSRARAGHPRGPRRGTVRPRPAGRPRAVCIPARPRIHGARRRRPCAGGIQARQNVLRRRRRAARGGERRREREGPRQLPGREQVGFLKTVSTAASACGVHLQPKRRASSRNSRPAVPHLVSPSREELDARLLTYWRRQERRAAGHLVLPRSSAPRVASAPDPGNLRRGRRARPSRVWCERTRRLHAAPGQPEERATVVLPSSVP